MSAVIFQCQRYWQLGGYFAAASWTVNVWDGLIRFEDEISFIWRMPCTAYIKWLYLFAKYVGLAMQTGLLVTQLSLTNHPAPIEFCRLYRAFEMMAVTFLVLCFDIVLILRIYALSGRRTWICVFANCVVLIESVVTITSMAVTIPVTMYDGACVMVPVPKSTLVYTIGMFITQATLLWLAFRHRQYTVLERRSIAYITIRDGVLAFVFLSAFLVTLVAFQIYESPLTTTMVCWLSTIFSVSTCRIILNLQRAPNADSTSTRQFTTEIWGLDESFDSYLLTHLPYLSHSP